MYVCMLVCTCVCIFVCMYVCICVCLYALCIQIFQKRLSWLIVEPNGTLGIVIMSDSAPAKIVTVWPWHYDEPVIYIMESQS